LHIQSQHFFLGRYPRTLAEATPVLGPRPRLPLGSPAFLYCYCFTKRPHGSNFKGEGYWKYRRATIKRDTCENVTSATRTTHTGHLFVRYW